jgi:AmmeMemoRadiSam system protein B
MMPTTDDRRPAVAGTFYPRDAPALRELVMEFLDDVVATPQPAVAAIAPHAGLVYSGRCAATVFRHVTPAAVVVILAPNHTGRCAAPGGVSLWAHGAFATPLGSVPIASAFAEALRARCSLVAHDPTAHTAEHAIEVELPFLQTLAPESEIVPLVLAWDDWAHCRTLAEALAELVRQWPQDVLLLASSDMTHYEPAARAAGKDRIALEAIGRLDGEELLAACRRERITMCGRAPAAVVLEAAKRLGASEASVVDYRHSGQVTGDDTSVVAYAGVVVR